MRVSPTAYAANSLESVLELAERTAAVTHNHPDGILELRLPQAVCSWLELVIQNRKFEDLPLRSSIMNCLANWMKFATHILLMSLVPLCTRINHCVFGIRFVRISDSPCDFLLADVSPFTAKNRVRFNATVIAGMLLQNHARF